MNYRSVLFLLGRLQLVLGIALLVPAMVGYFEDDAHYSVFLVPAAFVAIVGLFSERQFRQPPDFRFGRREALLLVSSAWVMASLIGALPYLLINGPSFLVDALFESTSGFTTTGASILPDIEAQPRSLLLWRSLTQWLGGMGIIVLGIAILPRLSVGGMQLLGAEALGPFKEKLTPRIVRTAEALWGIYVLLTGLAAGALLLAGVGLFEAINHAMTTIATGGFSSFQGGVGAFRNPTVELVIVLFMVLAGVNFALHFKLLRGRLSPVFRDAELRLYLFLLLAATLLLSGNLLLSGQATDLASALRLGAFQSAAVITTTGHNTADFNAWPDFSRTLIFVLMFVGACAGSTGGSIKVVRVLIVIKKLAVDLRRMVRPNAVLPVRVGRRAVPDEVVTSVTTFLVLFLGLFAVGGLLLAAIGLDVVSAFGASAACLGNIGPGFGLVGPAQGYALIPVPAKLVLMALMVIGRLELYTVLATLYLGRKAF